MEQTLITDAFESTSFTTEISNNVAINNNEDNTCDVEVKTDVDSGLGPKINRIYKKAAKN